MKDLLIPLGLALLIAAPVLAVETTNPLWLLGVIPGGMALFIWTELS